MSKLRTQFVFFMIAVFFYSYACGQSEAKNILSPEGTPEKISVVDEPRCISEKNTLPKERPAAHKQAETIGSNQRPKPENINSSEDNGEQQEANEEAIMEEALELLNGSQKYWANGDLENALGLLDQAYVLLIDADGHPAIARQKDDLRLLIAKQILVIYTSVQTITNGKRGEIPLVMNADVAKEIRNFQTVERDFFLQSYKRSGLYRPIILQELEQAGLPEELSWLPLVESGFKICAFSRARALGLWQFIPSTGFKYGLNRDEWIDQRMDVEKSTRAAIDYLKELHNMFGDWLTVLAAYNCGEGRVLREISSQKLNYLDRFWDLYHKLPNETARYVPRFLAILHIIKDPQKYGIDLVKDEALFTPPSYELIKTSKQMRLQDIARHLNISEEVLNTLNTELRYKVTPDKEYELKVPMEVAEKFAAVVDEIPRWEKPSPVLASVQPLTIKHRVKRKETLASIAQRYKTSVKAIRTCNHISPRRSIHVGQYLDIPVRNYRYARAKENQEPSNKVTGKLTKYNVKKGDTLSSLARRFNTNVSEIKKINRLRGNPIKIGQIIMVAPNKKGNNNKASVNTTAVTKYTVKKGDSLSKIAEKNNISLNQLLNLNNLARIDTITPGQVIIVR
ncbi:MAG: LysM peptidoglycan-binding domain-containing protein [Syntrophales bacterium]